MDHSRRKPDRTDPLRALSRPLAGGSLQILQQHLRSLSQPSDHTPEGSRRGTGGEVGNPADLTHRCEHCGSAFDRFSKVTRKYCSRQCADAARTVMEREARASENAAKPCPECGGPLPAGRRRNAVFCSSRCAGIASVRRRASRAAPAICVCCGDEYQPESVKRKFCSVACSRKSKIRHPVKSCAWCGSPFRRRNVGATFCSPSCSSKNGWATGRLRVVPRKLTVRSVDRMFEQMRPKRPYVQRLTTARLDKMFDTVWVRR